MKTLMILCVLASVVSAEGRIPMAIITENGGGGYSSCMQGVDCYYDTHPTSNSVLFGFLAKAGLFVGFFALMGAGFIKGIKYFVNKGGRSGGLIRS